MTTEKRMGRGVVIGDRPWRTVVRFPNVTVSKLDALVRVHTGFKSFAELCRNNPTLRSPPGSSKKTKKDFAILRKAYKNVTGRQ